MDNSRKDSTLIYQIVQAENFSPEDLEILTKLIAQIIQDSLDNKNQQCSRSVKDDQGCGVHSLLD